MDKVEMTVTVMKSRVTSSSGSSFMQHGWYLVDTDDVLNLHGNDKTKAPTILLRRLIERLMAH